MGIVISLAIGTAAGWGSKKRCPSDVAITESGKQCQRWDQQWPHRHSIDKEDMANPDDYHTNKCRQPDEFLDIGHHTPWCYTIYSNTRWEECNVPEQPELCDSDKYADDRFLGCWRDETDNRAMEADTIQRWYDDNTVDKCIAYCKNKGKQHAAVQNGYACMCSYSHFDIFAIGAYKKHGRAPGCDVPCPKGEGFCGGVLRNAVFKTGAVLTIF